MNGWKQLWYVSQSQPHPPVQNIPNQWLMQKCLRATTQNTQDGCRISHNTLNQQAFTAQPTTVIYRCSHSTAQHFVDTRQVFAPSVSHASFLFVSLFSVVPSGSFFFWMTRPPKSVSNIKLLGIKVSGVRFNLQRWPGIRLGFNLTTAGFN